MRVELMRGLVVALVWLVASCGPPGGGGGEDGEIAVELGVSGVDGEFDPLEDGEDVRLVRGFQGGYHVEMGVRVSGRGHEAFTGVLDYTARDAATGETISDEPLTYQIVDFGWRPTPDGWVHTGDFVIMDIAGPTEVDGRTLNIGVGVSIEGQTATDDVTVDVHYE